MEDLQQELLVSKTAVLVVDVQNDYCHQRGQLAKNRCDVSMVEAMMPRLHQLLRAARESGAQVIFVRTVHEDATDSVIWKNRAGGKMTKVCRPGSWGAGFYEVGPREREYVVDKSRYSAFIGTRLDMILRAHSIQTLLIAGVSTNVCVESTARDGCMLDYHIILAGDACAAYSMDAHEMTLKNIGGYFGQVMAVEEIQKMLEAPDQTVYKLSARA